VVGFHQDRIGLVFLDLDRGLQQYWILWFSFDTGSWSFSGILDGWAFRDRIGLDFLGWILVVFSGTGSTGFFRLALVFQRVVDLNICVPSVGSFMAFQWLLKVSRSES